MNEIERRWWCEDIYKALTKKQEKPPAEELAFLMQEYDAIYYAAYEEGVQHAVYCQFSEPDRCAARRYNCDLIRKLKGTETAYNKIKEENELKQDEIDKLKQDLEKAKKDLESSLFYS